MIKVSVIVPVYNPGDGIDRCISSLREQALRETDNPPFSIQTRRAPAKCPLCGTMANVYREEHPGEELLLPTGHPFTCAVCGNTDYWA